MDDDDVVLCPHCGKCIQDGGYEGLDGRIYCDEECADEEIGDE
jgi:hypothetical protein